MNMNAIFLPTQGAPKIAECNYKDQTPRQILKTNTTTHTVIRQLRKSGYKLIIMNNEQNNGNINHLASLIAHTSMRGDCLLIDSGKDLSIDDLSKIVSLSKKMSL